MSPEEVHEHTSVCLILVVIIWNLDIGSVEAGVDYGLLENLCMILGALICLISCFDNSIKTEANTRCCIMRRQAKIIYI